MATAALIAVGVLALLMFVMITVLVELFRDVRQIRDAVGILDRPLSIDIGPAAGAAPSTYGLPLHLDTEKSALVLFLQDRCSTCRVLAAALRGTMPAGFWIVVEAGSRSAAVEFVNTFGMMDNVRDGRVLIDPDGAIAERLGLDTTPVAYRIEDGVFASAGTVPSTRYLASIIPVPVTPPIDVGNELWSVGSNAFSQSRSSVLRWLTLSRKKHRV